MFGLSPSPFELEDTIKNHLEWYKKDQTETVMELKQNIYVGDVGETTWSLQKNSGIISYKLNKCHSNVPELEEEEDISQIQTDETYAKQQLSKRDTKATILGISLNKQDDKLEVKFGQSQTETTQHVNLWPLRTDTKDLSMRKYDLQTDLQSVN